MSLQASTIQHAFRCLKSYAYHENLNLFLKQRVAEFETNIVTKNIEVIKEVIESKKLEENMDLSEWLKQIFFHVLPKNVQTKEENEPHKSLGSFISNINESEYYNIEKINYFINAPVELHIIEILWCMYVGPVLEKGMTKDSYGNRLHPSFTQNIKNPSKNNGQEIFKKYIDQYNNWRENAIHLANETAKNGDNVVLLSLDLKSYYYNINLDYNKIYIEISNFYPIDSDLYKISFRLTEILEKIHKQYYSKIYSYLSITHPNCALKNGIPLGFTSSAILANWYLLSFDQSISEDVRPAYYGRYVDDMIFVFKNPVFDSIEPIKSIFNKYLNGVIDYTENEYFINIDDNLIPLQNDKLLMQYYDKNHSTAGLDVFRNQLDERSSAFEFLSNDHMNKELDKYAYCLLHNNSSNNIYNFIGLGVNESGLSKYLSSHITTHRLSKLDKKDSVLPQLKNLFKGKSALGFHRMWEKVYQYSLITNNYNFVKYFYEYLELEILKIFYVDRNNLISELLIQDLHLFNQISLSINLGLLDIKESKDLFLSMIKEDYFYTIRSKINNLIKLHPILHIFSWQFRKSNLIRHQLVGWPLANYSNYSGDLTCERTFNSDESFELDEEKLKFTPRFIHYDEWQIFKLSQHLISPDINLNKWFKSSQEEYEEKIYGDKLPIYLNKLESLDSKITKSEIKVKEDESKSTIKLAIGNFVVDEKDIALALRKDSSPNISFTRQEKLYSILQNAVSEKSDILVMPEVSIPVSWLPFLISFSRKYQIGLIFGLEHWVSKNKAYNLIIEALPFRISNVYNSCAFIARIKNHYAPAELDLLNTLRIQPANDFKPQAYYHKVSWRGVTFTTYNCFELSDITHRILFKSEIDLLFACVWNKDTNYYQHILESTVRDLHCYTVQTNTSQYGGSCVLRPTKTQSKTMLYVKGGENPCVLTTNLNISELRKFQFKSNPNQSDNYKHLPPGYDNELVLKR